MADNEPAKPEGEGAKPDPKPGENPAPDKSTGTEPAKPAESQFDPSKLSDDDFNKIYEHDRLFKHPRFKSLAERAKEADKLKSDAEAAEKKRLEEEGKWKELAEKNAAEAETAKKTAENYAIRSSIQAAAAKQGVVDLDAAATLIDRTNIKINEDGAVEGVDEALTKLLEDKPYLKGKTTTPVGSPSNPSPDQTEQGTKKFKLSQIQDHKFFAANEKEIMQALKLGLIENDTIPGQPAPQTT